MESSLMRTLKTKDRLCYGTTKDGASELPRTTRTRRRRGYLALALEVSKEAQEAILGIRPEIMHPGSSKTATIGRFRQRRGRRCQSEYHEILS
jgi:hypothetical protein